MRKIFTILLLTFFVLEGWSQTCTVMGSDYATNFINCANDPATEIIEFAPTTRPSGYGPIFINGTSPEVDLTGLTILVPPKITLVFTGNVKIDAGTNFQTSSGGTQGNSEVQFGADGTVYKGNPSPQIGFNALNDLIVSCSADPNPMECLEIQSFLPVELTAFSGMVSGRQVILNWTTATELNNDYFMVEHSTDGDGFQPVGQLKGAGTSAQEIRYVFTHRQAAAGTNYYRLKQVDFDGTYAYSDLIAVEMGQPGQEIQLFPNPTADRVNIQLDKHPERANVQLYNLLGKQLDLIPTTTDSGWRMDLADLASGIYLLRIAYDGEVITRQLVKK